MILQSGRKRNKKALRHTSQSFLFKSATTYFHKPFPANYLRHK